MQEQAAAAIADLGLACAALQDAIIDAAGVPSLLTFIRAGSPLGQEHAARAIRNLVTRYPVDSALIENQNAIVECGTIPELVQLTKVAARHSANLCSRSSRCTTLTLQIPHKSPPTQRTSIRHSPAAALTLRAQRTDAPLPFLPPTIRACARPAHHSHRRCLPLPSQSWRVGLSSQRQRRPRQMRQLCVQSEVRPRHAAGGRLSEASRLGLRVLPRSRLHRRSRRPQIGLRALLGRVGRRSQRVIILARLAGTHPTRRPRLPCAGLDCHLQRLRRG